MPNYRFLGLQRSLWGKYQDQAKIEKSDLPNENISSQTICITPRNGILFLLFGQDSQKIQVKRKYQVLALRLFSGSAQTQLPPPPQRIVSECNLATSTVPLYLEIVQCSHCSITRCPALTDWLAGCVIIYESLGSWIENFGNKCTTNVLHCPPYSFYFYAIFPWCGHQRQSRHSQSARSTATTKQLLSF